ncbi:MAG: site-2 protease family protein [Caldilineaceae bacterium]
MGKNLAEFRLLGIDVKVHWSFILILAFGAFVYGAGPAGWLVGGLYGVLTFLLLFVCVTLHEYGHALTARHYGIQTRSILLLPIGGVANLERMPDKPHQEMVIAIAGPLVNFAIAALLVPVVFLVGGVEAGGSLGQTRVLSDNLRAPGPVNLLLYLFLTNVLLAVFNLLPAFPMDGGRLLRALLAMVIPYMQATRIAVLIGRLVAVGMAVYGIFTGGITLMLVAFFVYVGGSAELEAVSSRAVLRSVRAGAAIAPGAISLYTSERLERAMDLILTTYQTDYPVLDLGGRFAGVLTRQRLVSALRELGPDTRIVEVMAPSSEVPEVQASADLATVWETMSQQGSRIVAVRNGAQFAGIITNDDISEVFQVVGAAMEGRRRHQPPAAAAPVVGLPELDTWADSPDTLPADSATDRPADGTTDRTTDKPAEIRANTPASMAPEQENENA